MDLERLPESGKNNFWYHYNDDSDAVFIFVHGLMSDSRGCWLSKDDQNGNGTCYWPELINSDNRFQHPGIFLAGYYTAIDSGDFPFQQCAQQLYPFLTNRDSQGNPPAIEKKKIIFICHSLGGIVIRHLLCEYRDRFKDKQVGLVLIASPSYGSRLTRKLGRVIHIYNHRQAKQLEWGNELLRDLDRRFRDLKERRQIPNLCGKEFFENRFIFASKWLPFFYQSKVVTEESAARYFANPVQIGGSDHSSICKPRTIDDPVHQSLFDFLRENELLPSKTESASPIPPSTLVFAPSLDLQAAQGLVDLSAHSLQPLSTGLQPVELAPGVSLIPPVQSAAALRQTVREKPRIEELFEVITDPDRVAEALFQTEQANGFAPYDVEYVSAREDIPDVQQALQKALARGRLLVYGPSGIGKTREIAELARAVCATKWTVLFARYEGDPRIDLQLAMPAALIDAKLLIVIDNLHTRIIADSLHTRAIGGADQPPPYLERLEGLLGWFERLLPGRVRVLAAAQEEPRDQSDLAPTRDGEGWHGFGLFHLPTLTDEGLRRLLTALAERGGVPVAADDVPALIENSDRKPATVVINVDVARQKRTALTRSLWKPTGDESWQLRFVSARAEHPGLGRLCWALRLLNDAGLPARSSYVTALTRALGEPRPEEIIEKLVGDGLFRARRGILSPFSAEQLQEWLGETAASATGLLEQADVIERAITDRDNGPEERIDDLLALSLGLARADHPDRAEQVASRVIASGAGGSRPYRVRAAFRIERGDVAGAEADLTRAIEVGGDEADTCFGRAAMRLLLGNYIGSLEDLEVVTRSGRDDAAVHAQRGAAYYQLGRLNEAEAAMTAAIERGESSGMIFFTRAGARLQLDDAAGAEQDLSAALEQDVDLEDTFAQLRKILGSNKYLPSSPGSAGRSGIVYALRGFARLKLGRNADAEEDLTAAIEQKGGEAFQTLANALDDQSLPMFATVKDRLSDMRALNEGTLFALRGASRVDQGKLAQALEDFDQALDRGCADGGVYVGRGWARLRMGQFAAAAEDATTALEIGRSDAPAYALRGCASLALNNFSEAEQDLAKAIELDGENAQFFAWRGAARAGQTKLQEAEADLTAALDRRVDPQTLFMRGGVRLDLQRNVEAEQDLTGAAELGFSGDGAQLLTCLGTARARQGKLGDAEADLTAALESRADARTLFVRGGVRFDLGKSVEAEQDLTAALELGFDQAVLFTLRGLARVAQNKMAEADEDATAAFTRGAADIPAYSLRAAVRLEQERYAEAEADLTEAMRLGRTDAWVLFYRGRARQSLERFAEAEEDYDAAIALGNDAAIAMGIAVADPFISRGRARLAQQKWPEAEQDFSAAAAAGRDDGFVHFLLSFALDGQKRHREAETELDFAIARGSQPAYYRQRGYLRMVRGNFHGAENDLDETIARETADAEALRLRGLARYAQRKHVEALADYNDALKISPDEGALLSGRMQAHLRLGNVDEAAKDCDRLRVIDAAGVDAEGYSGVLRLARGDLGGALDRLTAAATRDSDWYYWQGLALVLSGRYQEAREAYAKASPKSLPGDILIALDELDFHLDRYPTQAASPAAQATAASIRTELRNLAEPDESKVTQ